MAAARPTREQLARENEELRARLAEAEETLRAIREGEVDAIVVSGTQGEQVFSLSSAEQVYRLIAETMREAALTVAFDGTVLFANAQFGELVRRPLEQVVGRPFREFVHPDNRAAGDALLLISQSQPVRQRLVFRAADGAPVPAHVASNVLHQPNGPSLCLTVADLTELENSTELIQQLRRQQEELRASRAAALNLMENAVEARQKAEQAAAALAASEERYRTLFETMTEGFALHEIILDAAGQPCDYRFLEVNPAFERLTGLKAADIVGRTVLEFLPGTERHWIETYGRVALTGEPAHIERLSDRLGRWYEVFAYRAAPGRFAVVFSDVTERKQREERIARLTRLYAVLSRVNEAIVRIGEEEPLCREVCRIVAEEGGFPLVWVGEARAGQVAPVAWAGPEAEYLKGIQVTVDGELGHGPTGTCVREGRPVVNIDFKTNPSMARWREQGLRHGFRASAAFPLRRDGAAVGALTLYAPTPGAFDEEQVRLLDALSADLSYALDKMQQERLRFEAEEALRRSEQSLRQSRELLEAVTRGAKVLIAAVNTDFRYTYFNQEHHEELRRLTGKDTAIGMSLMDVLADMPEERDKAVALWGRALKGETVTQTLLFGDPGRYRRCYSTSHTPIRDADGTVMGAGEVTFDITPLMQVQEALRASEERLRIQVENMPIACILHDAEFRFTGWNSAAERIFGYSAAEALGTHPCDLIVPPKARDHVRQVLQRIAAGEPHVPSVNENLTKGGQTILCRWTNTPVRDAQGRVAGLLSMAEDVTETIRARQALLQSQEDMDRAQAVAQAGSWRLDVQRNVLLWSEENWRIFGLPKGTPLTYETFVGTIHPDDRARVDEQWQGALRGEPYDIEHRIVGGGDSVKWVREKAFLEFDPDGTLRGGFGITQDITERKHMEEALRRAHDQLELRVRERTAELAETLAQLEAEMAERERGATLLGVSARLLGLFGEKTSRRDYLQATVQLLHEWSGCRCVGLRVLAGDGLLPYAAHLGFSAEFMKEEMVLDTQATTCACVRVATGTTELQDAPALTAGGSFACVDAPSFAAGLSAAEAARYRGVCMRVGFRTIVVVPVRHRGRALGAIHLADEMPGRLSAEDVEFLESRALLIGEALHRFSLEEEILAISEEERRRIGQELHDAVGQQLTGVAYLVDLLEDSLAGESRPEAAEAARVREQLSEAIARARDLSHGLYPVRLGAGGLASALAQLAESVSMHRGVACALECNEGAAVSDEGTAIHLFRIAQEAVNNALKHARASRICIRLHAEPHLVRLEVHDDGVGLAPDWPKGQGRGLHIMRYRAESLGGRLEALPKPEGGTLVSCAVPGRPTPQGVEGTP